MLSLFDCSDQSVTSIPSMVKTLISCGKHSELVGFVGWSITVLGGKAFEAAAKLDDGARRRSKTSEQI